MQTGASPRFYFPELDGLRFIAFMLVFVHNAPSISSSKIWAALHEYGWIGVDLFFCLSAYLITRLLVMEHKETGNINIAGFYVRRILRIWPLYFLYIGLILLSPALAQRDASNQYLQIAGVATFTYNFVFIYVFPFAIPALIHLWTISFEEQFYVAVPWVVRNLAGLTAKAAWSFLLTAFLAGTVIRAALVYLQVKHPVIYVLPFTRFESILSGMALGLGLLDKLKGISSGRIFMLLGVGLLVAVIFFPNVYQIGWLLMVTYLLVGAAMLLIFYAVLQSRNSFLEKLLTNPLLVYLGKISYGLYMFHLLGIMLAFQIQVRFLIFGDAQTKSQAFFVFLIGLVITIVFAALSYQFYETPFLRMKQRFSSVASRPT